MINLLEVKTSVLSVLSLLRTMIAMMVGGFVWVLVNNALGQPPGVMVLLPVWIAGMAGGAVCTMYSARQGIPMAAVSGLLQFVRCVGALPRNRPEPPLPRPTDICRQQCPRQNCRGSPPLGRAWGHGR